MSLEDQPEQVVAGCHGSLKPQHPSPMGSGELEPSPATQASTYGVQRSLNSLAMVSMPPARATAM